MRPLTLFAAALLATLTACTSSPAPDRKSDPAPTASKPATQAQLLGHWGADPTTAGDGGEPWVRFDYNGKYAGDDGCNSIGGTWSLDEKTGAIRFGDTATTLVACPDTTTASFDQMTLAGTSLRYVTKSGRKKVMPSAPGNNLPMYLIDKKTDQLERVPAPLPAIVATKTPEVRTAAAIEALMLVKEDNKSAYSNLWGPLCRLGTGVKTVTTPTKSTAAVVTLTGHGGATCDMSLKGYELRSQQLAWTVVQGLGLKEGTPVRVQGPTGRSAIEEATIVPDLKVLVTSAS